MAPGECIIHDKGGEFYNKLVRRLSADFGVDMRCIKAGRPMANGQAESAVKLVKNKIRMLALKNSNTFFKYLNIGIESNYILIFIVR